LAPTTNSDTPTTTKFSTVHSLLKRNLTSILAISPTLTTFNHHINSLDSDLKNMFSRALPKLPLVAVPLLKSCPRCGEVCTCSDLKVIRPESRINPLSMNSLDFSPPHQAHYHQPWFQSLCLRCCCCSVFKTAEIVSEMTVTLSFWLNL